jgi:serine/threonine protein kinase
MSGNAPPTRRILVVDRDPRALAKVRRLLASDSCAVETAASPTHAFGLIDSMNVDLMVSESAFGDVSGLDFLGELRKRYPEIPFVFLTSKPSIRVAVDALKSGAADYLDKSTSDRILRVKLLAALSGDTGEPFDAAIDVSADLQNLAGYSIKGRLGDGAFGIVFLVEGRKGAEYALKVLKHPDDPDEQDRMRTTLERFLRECEAAAAIDHENVVCVRDFGISDQPRVPYILYEYFPSRPLNLLSTETEIPPRRKVHIIRDVCRGLAELHRKDICHRDIKPENILVDRALKVKITDFGIAKFPNSEITREFGLLGSPAYVAPEAFASPHVSVQADIFSLGTVTYEFLLGVHPFAREDLISTSVAIREETPREPRKIDPNFPPALQSILGCMLRKNPTQRYADADALLAALDEYLAGPEPKPNIWERMPWTSRWP